MPDGGLPANLTFAHVMPSAAQITEATSECCGGPRPTLPTTLQEADLARTFQ